MSLTNNSDFTMPVMPMGNAYGNGGGFGFGDNGAWWLLILLFALGGWGNGGFGGGFGGCGGDIYPWMNQSNQINDGFRDQMINGNVTEIRSGVTGLANQLCNCCGDIQMALANGFAGVEQGANARQMANMQSIFGVQSALQTGFCDNRSSIADLKYTVATENCADRTQSLMNTRDIIDSQNKGTQAILDKLCQLELDGVKGELSAANNTINQLRTQLVVANNDASQTAQTAAILAGQTAEVDALYNRLSNCPVPTTPVYGRTPIFTCNNNNGGCGCGCGVA